MPTRPLSDTAALRAGQGSPSAHFTLNEDGAEVPGTIDVSWDTRSSFYFSIPLADDIYPADSTEVTTAYMFKSRWDCTESGGESPLVFAGTGKPEPYATLCNCTGAVIQPPRIGESGADLLPSRS